MNTADKQTKIYTKLYEIGKNINESISEDQLFDIALTFASKDLGFEKCLIFKHDESNGWFKVEKSVGYDKPQEQMILKIINLLLSGEIIEYLRVSGKPIVHTQNAIDEKVVKLAKSLFLSEAYFELFGGDIRLPYALMIVGNSLDKKESSPDLDKLNQLALGNAISQFSNVLNNIIFYKAYENEKKELEHNIQIRTEELEEQKNRFQTIYETSKDGIAILDVQTTAFLETNQAFAEMIGYTQYELIRTSCLKLSFEKDIQRSKVAIQKVFKDGYITNFIKDCKTKDGSFVTINMSVSDLYDGTVLVSAKDITKQMKLEEETKRQKEMFEVIYNASTESIAIMDMSSQFLTINPAYLKMTGFSYEEILKTSCVELSHPDDLEHSAQGLSSLHAVGYIKNFEKRCRIKDGSYIDINMSAVMLRNPDRILSNVRDITQEKIVKEELELAKDRAEESTKSKSEFLANMSHEIRTPMNGIIGINHLALQTELTDKQQHYLHKIDSSAKSLLGIINDILDFSKIEAGKLSIEKIEFDIFKVVEGVINLIEFKAHEKNLEIIVDYDKEIGKNFFGDSLRLGQILTNLMSNAIKFTESGEIGIYIQRISADRFMFSVKDTGIGIKQEEQEKLFNSFSQADGSTTRKYGGTGLGLSISKQLIELMNGQLWVESESDKGSKFIFEIELQEIEANNSFNLFDGKKILVVDDNRSWHNVLGGILDRFGLGVEHAYSGSQAIEKCHDTESNYDLILMDWNMPELDGIETTKLVNNMCSMCDKESTCIRASAPPAVIMVSSFKQESIIKLAQEVGIKTFLQKPINPSILNDVLSEVFVEDYKSTREEKRQSKDLKYNLNSLLNSSLLLVEDNETNQEIILGLLEDSGIKIDIANNGKEAVELTNTKDYELILMDIQMPIMDGYEATKIIRERNRDIPIVALTANAMREDVQRTKNAGMNEHLNKPIEVEKLYATLLKYISKKSDAIVEIDEADEIKLPKFQYINTKQGLKHLAGNIKLYLKILGNFKSDYSEFNIDELNKVDFKRATHTLKGLSANIGAASLHTKIKELDETQDKNLLKSVYHELKKVIEDLQLLVEQKSEESAKLLEPSSKTREELFSQLKEFTKKNRANRCKSIIQEIEKYQLGDEDKIVFNRVKELVYKYKFKDALLILEEMKW
ncbi:MAG: hypothetical protein DRG30_02890 [Epsilonproteobacteria bacterium]|nr:MAG: hypothetical protein DRG30_02890 [Campylobacterota bacterium]